MTSLPPPSWHWAGVDARPGGCKCVPSPDNTHLGPPLHPKYSPCPTTATTAPLWHPPAGCPQGAGSTHKPPPPRVAWVQVMGPRGCGVGVGGGVTSAVPVSVRPSCCLPGIPLPGVPPSLGPAWGGDGMDGHPPPPHFPGRRAKQPERGALPHANRGGDDTPKPYLGAPRGSLSPLHPCSISPHARSSCPATPPRPQGALGGGSPSLSRVGGWGGNDTRKVGPYFPEGVRSMP